MKFLSVLNARSVWLFDTADLNPRGKHIFPANVEWLKENYGFVKLPANIGDVDKNGGLLFQSGSFQTKTGDLVSITEMAIYNDGIIVNSRSSTKDTDEFLEDALTRLAKEFDLPYSPEMIRVKQYLSELRFQLEYPLSNLNRHLQAFSLKVSSLRSDLPPFEFTGLSFGVDTTTLPTKPSGFVIERQINTAFAENRYYSKAPLHTDAHIKILEDFETDLLATPK
jgi:hypothetical protein